jgi:tRNA 2-thiouridine synthesizing protein C
LLLDDAVFHLKKQQNPEAARMKDTAALFKALAMYDVNDLHAETESLAERGITTEDMILPVQALPRAEVNAFMSQFDIVWAS